jgi:hypothetical protein
MVVGQEPKAGDPRDRLGAPAGKRATNLLRQLDRHE